jgi:hypothetical protein
MTAQTHKAVATGPTGNLQGCVKFYCLKTGQILKRRLFTPLPMPDRVIKWVNAIGVHEKQGQEFWFLIRRKEPYEWTDEVPEDDLKFQGLLKETAQYPDIPAKLPGVELEREIKDDQVVTDEPEPDFAKLAAAALEDAGIDPQDRLHSAQAAVDAPPGPTLIAADADKIMYKITFILPDAGLVEPGIVPNYDTTPGAAAATHIDNDVQNLVTGAVELLTDNAHQPARRCPTQLRRSVIGNEPYNRYSLQTTFLQLGEMQAHRSIIDGRQYARMTKEERIHTTTWSGVEQVVDDMVHTIDKELVTKSEDELKVWAYMMTQYNLKPGLQKFREKGATAAIDELTQLQIMDTWTAMDPSQVRRKDKVQALLSLLFLKEKQTGKIKGRACINGAPQWAYIPKEEAASLTVLTESTFIAAAIAANEHRGVRCYNIPSVFVNMDVDEDVLMVLKGKLAEMMVKIAPQVYRKYVTVDRKGTPILYVKLQKALYGLMRASLLFYRKLRKEMEQYEFMINPYNPCVANKTTASGKQLTIIWHVDDLMGSCEEDFELTKFLCYLANLYGPK